MLDALCAHADVMVDSFRPSTARRLGVDAETMRCRHPHLVCASISGFGATGPYVERAAHDINYQALAGLLRPPATARPTGRRHRRGDAGRDAHRRGACSSAREPDWAARSSCRFTMRRWTGRCFRRPPISPARCYNIYETSDGQWLALGALEPKFWKGFCERIGRPDLIPLQHAPRATERTWVVNAVRAVFRTRTRDEWLARFADDDVCLTHDLHAGGGVPRSARRCAAGRRTRRTRPLRRSAPIPTPCSRPRASRRNGARLRAAGVI